MHREPLHIIVFILKYNISVSFFHRRCFHFDILGIQALQCIFYHFLCFHLSKSHCLVYNFLWPESIRGF